jgi:hypothetical protein
MLEDGPDAPEISSQTICMSGYSAPDKSPFLSEPMNLKKSKYKKYRHISRLNQRKLRPFGIYMNGGGPALFGASLEFFISTEINLKAGGGWTSAFAGFEYHFMGFKKTPWTPYTGILASYSWNSDFGIYIPFGFHFISKSGLSLAFDVALWIKNTDITDDSDSKKQIEPFGSGSVRLGYRF